MSNRLKTFLIFFVIVFLILISFKERARGQAPVKVTKHDPGATVSVRTSTKYQEVHYFLFGASGLSKLQKTEMRPGIQIEVPDMAIIWLIGRRDTTAVSVIAPVNPGDVLIVKFNGYNPMNGETSSRVLWAYEEVVPELRKMGLVDF